MTTGRPVSSVHVDIARFVYEVARADKGDATLAAWTRDLAEALAMRDAGRHSYAAALLAEVEAFRSRDRARKRSTDSTDSTDSMDSPYRAEQSKAEQSKAETLMLAPSPSDSAPPVEPPVLVFRCQGNPPTWNLTKEQIGAWSALYPGLDVLATCRQAYAWAEANAGKRKTAKGMPGFLVSWLSRETNSGRARGPRQSDGYAPVVRPPQPRKLLSEAE